MSNEKQTKAKVKTVKANYSVTIRFKKLKDGKQSVYLDIYAGGKRSYQYLNLILLPGDDEKTAKANKKLMKQAEAAKKAIEKEVKAQAAGSKRLSDKPIIVTKGDMLLVDWLKEFVAIQERRKIRTINSVRMMARIVEAYDNKIQMKNVDRNFCVNFVNHLKSDYRNVDGSKPAPKTIYRHLANLNTALNTAVRHDVIPNNPILKMSTSERIKPTEVQRDFLTIDEVKKLIATPCKNKLVKQAYLFSCNCGLRLSDVKNLKWKDISMIGEYWTLSTVMLKSTRPVYIPMGKQARRWLPAKKRTASPDDHVFKGLTKKVNEHLATWVKKAGITKTITFHTSRHTFATTLLTLGADLYVTSRLLGHANVRTTQRYAKIINKQKDEAVKLFNNVFELDYEDKTVLNGGENKESDTTIYNNADEIEETKDITINEE